MSLATESTIIPITAGAAALTKGKVVMASSGTAIVTTGPTVAALGVVTEGCDANGTASVAVDGIVYVEVSASGIAIGDNLAPTGSAGQCNKSTTATHKAFAVALEASTAAGELIKAKLGPGYIILA